jgi:hypothetical protein
MESGRGVLYADGEGTMVSLGERALTIREGAAAFEAGGEPQAWLLAGEGMLDGRPLSDAPAEMVAALSRPDLCAPSTPSLRVRLGDPGILETAAVARARDADGAGGESATAEGGATCVDSADTSSATDPSQGADGGIDPDARRDIGRLRIRIRVPRRSL